MDFVPPLLFDGAVVFFAVLPPKIASKSSLDGVDAVKGVGADFFAVAFFGSVAFLDELSQ